MIWLPGAEVDASVEARLAPLLSGPAFEHPLLAETQRKLRYSVASCG